MCEQETIEVNGVRFSASEVHEVTIKRDGNTIKITSDDEKKPVVGFSRSD